MYSWIIAKVLTYSTYTETELILFRQRKNNENYLRVNTLGKEIQVNAYKKIATISAPCASRWLSIAKKNTTTY
jgi:hypothetical protein